MSSINFEDTEYNFLSAAADGNVDVLLEVLENPPTNFDPNCMDSLDRTALTLAILNNNLDVIHILLDTQKGSY